tara:strand:+ start:2734 stop:3207 length:474 start_codon:yes stop_codon:yes gene_type:complete
MRNLLLLLFVTSLFQVGAQIKKVDESEKSVLIGKAGSAFSTIASMYKIEGEPDYYFITFSNLKYQTLTDIKSFGFKDVEGAYDYLYSSVATAAKEKKKEVEFKLEDGILIVKIVKAVGVINVQFNWFESGVLSYSGYMTPKKFSKLFAKIYNKKEWK